MKRIIKYPVFLVVTIIAILTNSCYTGKPVADSKGLILPLSDSTELREGSIVYGLPETVFNIKVEMERTIEKPGPYAAYANDLLGLTNVIRNESETWSIKNVTVTSHEELDPAQLYAISSTTLFRTNVLALKKEGLILDINPGLYNSQLKANNEGKSDYNDFRSYDMGADEYFQIQRDTAYKRMNIDSSFVRIPYIVEKKKKLTIDQLAEKAAKRLMDLRDGKHLILTGEANVYPQSDASINELNRLEKEYTELFTGKTLNETFSFNYEIIPDKSMTGKQNVVFSFSDQTGPASESGKGGTPVTIEFNPEKKTGHINIINRVNSKSDDKKYDKLFYRVPDIVDVKISMGNTKLYSSRKLIYQFGEIIQLPSNYIIGK